jgi:uncharacterized Ntn-hydrolase superfamily protein
MPWTTLLPVVLLAVFPASPGAPACAARLAHTFSIVARDSVTGELGVAVQSHYFSVGPIVPWAEAGVGAVATQSLALVDYGPNGLDLMRSGMTAQQALDSLVRADAHNQGRQVAMVDSRGNVAAYTGRACIPDAGHQRGAQYSVQANLMANDRIWSAMAKAYESAAGDLAERLLAALDAAQQAGGDIRGRQSAALVVVKARSSGKPWADRLFDLRVEDSPEPLRELRRLVRLRRAYNLEDAGDNAIAERRPEEALRAYEEAMRLAPDVVELQFWAAVSMYTNGRRQEALPLFRKVFAQEARWVPLVERLPKADLFPDDPKQIAEVQAQATRGAKW